MTESMWWSLKPVHDILENISDDKGLVQYITSLCQTEIIIKISLYSWNNTYRMSDTICQIPSNIPNIQRYKQLYSLTRETKKGKKTLSINKTNWKW